MLFNSWAFIILVALTFGAYYWQPFRQYQIEILIISSTIFYAHNQPILTLLLFLSASVNAGISYNLLQNQVKAKQNLLIVLGIIFNLLILGAFKYSSLIAQTLFNDLPQVGTFSHTLITLPLPVGISFYTFQGISLLIDSSRALDNSCNTNKPLRQSPIFSSRLFSFSQYKANGDFWGYIRNCIFYIIFFPQLIAGPIVKAHQLLPQITIKDKSSIPWESVTRYLVLGYFLKMVIADNLQGITSWISYPNFLGLSSINLIFLLFAYSCQIFADFAGYSLIAIGVAALFGYTLPQNFNYPYIARSVTEFWRRWHITLSSWLREYLYIPLGGNRKGRLRTLLNLTLVMFLGGLWHGATWNYGIWGLWHGVGLTLERIVKKDDSQLMPRKSVHLIKSACQIVLTFTFISIGWLFFIFADIAEGWIFIKSLFDNWTISPNKLQITMIIFYTLPICIYHLQELIPEHKKYRLILTASPALYGLMAFLLLMNSGPKVPFIYFQF